MCQSKANKKKAGVKALISDKISDKVEFKPKILIKTKKILYNHAVHLRSHEQHLVM